MSLTALRSLAKKEKPVLGFQQTVKLLRMGKAKNVFLASNCPKAMKETVQRLASMSKANIIEMTQPNDELGVLLKRSHGISVLCFTAEE